MSPSGTVVVRCPLSVADSRRRRRSLTITLELSLLGSRKTPSVPLFKSATLTHTLKNLCLMTFLSSWPVSGFEHNSLIEIAR